MNTSVKETPVRTWDLVKHYMKPIESYLEMPGVTEIMIDNFGKIYVEKYGVLEDIPVTFKNNAEVERLIEQIGNALHQQVDRDRFPLLDARLTDENGRIKARINAVLPPIATRGACLTIRVFPPRILEAHDLLEKGVLTEAMLGFLKDAVISKKNIVISGSTGSGKTTLLNVLAGCIPKNKRIITIEDTIELQINAPYLVSMEAPRRKTDMKQDFQAVTMSTLLQNALRQRPDNIIVGELRTADAAMSFLQAINTGHGGCMTTLHANSSVDALFRLESLAASQSHGLPYEIIKGQIRRDIHLLVHQAHVPDQGRRITEITEIIDGNTQLVWHWDYAQQKHIMLINS